eukprot:696278-Pyramimonas_sp.AAC.1
MVVRVALQEESITARNLALTGPWEPGCPDEEGQGRRVGLAASGAIHVILGRDRRGGQRDVPQREYGLVAEEEGCGAQALLAAFASTYNVRA